MARCGHGLAGFVAGGQKARGFGTSVAAAGESRFFRITRIPSEFDWSDRIQGRAEFYRGGCNRLEQSRFAWVGSPVENQRIACQGNADVEIRRASDSVLRKFR